MSRRRFNSTENAELRAKIDEAKRRLPMTALLTKLGLGEHAKKEARCPFHRPDEHPSFSVFQKKDGTWWHQYFVGCSQGDEIAFLVKHSTSQDGKQSSDTWKWPVFLPRLLSLVNILSVLSL